MTYADRASEDTERYIFSLAAIRNGDATSVGNKCANLGELVRIGLPVPEGFAVSTSACAKFLRMNRLIDGINEDLVHLRTDTGVSSLRRASSRIMERGLSAPVPDEIVRQITDAYLSLGKGGSRTLVAVRSSSVGEDSPSASYAGQFDTFLNVKGIGTLISKVKRCWLSQFSPRALAYTLALKRKAKILPMAICVQRMIAPTCSGVMFTRHPISGDVSRVLLEGIWGLGEALVEGQVTPDRWNINKKTFRIETIVGRKRKMAFYYAKSNRIVRVPVATRLQAVPCLTRAEVTKLVRLGLRIEDHCGVPQDIEWACMKRKGTSKFYFLQSRPITTWHSCRTQIENKSKLRIS